MESGLAGDIASQASKSKAKTFLQEEDFPALDTPKTGPATVAVPSAQQKSQPAKSVPAAGKKVDKKAEKQKGKSKEEPKGKGKEEPKDREREEPAVKADNKPAEKVVAQAPSAPVAQPAKLNDKKPIPGILNIAAATSVSQSKPVDSPKATEKAASGKSAVENDSAFPALPTPITASILSPAARAAPKTLRVVSTPKVEMPSMTVPGSLRSAVAGVVRPETPGSEIISDSTSVVSAGLSLSRGGSPPPSRVGTAPLRAATKSQQRKARKEAVKKDAEAIVTPKPEPEVEIAPIVGRKKKQKKEKANTGSNTTPAESRPETPVAKEPAHAQAKEAKEVKESKETKEAKEAKEAKDFKEDSSAYRSTAHETMSLTEDKPPVRIDAKGKDRDMGDPGSAGSTSLDRLVGAQTTPSSVFQKLMEEDAFPGGIDSLAIAKPIAGGVNDKHRHDQPASSLLARDLLEKDLFEPQTKSVVNEEDQAALLEGKPVHKLVDGVRVMLTPYGDCVRNLSPEEEDRFLALQERVATAAASPAAFASTRHEAAGGFSLIKGRAVPNGPPTYFPRAPGAYPQDPVNKIQREEAIYYINQYVLPRIIPGTVGLSGSWKSALPNTLNLSDKAAGADLNYTAATTAATGAGGVFSSAFNDTVAPYMDTAAPELSYPGPSSSDQHHQHHPHQHQHYQYHQNIASVLVNHLAVADSWLDEQGPSKFAAAPGGLTTLGGPLAGVPLMSLEDAEQALAAARKETEKLEKSLNQAIKKNRKLLSAVGAAGHAASAAAGAGAGGQGISAH